MAQVDIVIFYLSWSQKGFYSLEVLEKGLGQRDEKIMKDGQFLLNVDFV